MAGFSLDDANDAGAKSGKFSLDEANAIAAGPAMSRMESTGRTVGSFLDRNLPENSTFRDAVFSTAAGIPKGIAGLYGMPVDLLNLWANSAPADQQRNPRSPVFNPLAVGVQEGGSAIRNLLGMEDKKSLPGGKADIEQFVERAMPLYQPQTTPGKFADTMTQFATQGGILGGGRGAFLGATGGAGSETGGQLTEGTPAEPWARLAGALLGTGIPSVMIPTSNAGRMLANRLEGTTAEDMQVARDRLAEGQRIGVPLSPAEAVDARPVQGLASDVAASPTGGPQVGRFFDERAATTPNAIRDKIAPDIASAPDYMRAAGARDAGKALTTEAQRAGYTAANPQSIDPMALRPVIQRLDNAIMMAPADVRRPLVALRNDIVESTGPVTNIDRLDTVRQTFAERINNAAEGVPQNAIRRAMQPILDDINDALKTNPQFAAGSAAYKQGAPAAQLLRQADDVLETAARPTQLGANRMAGVNFRNQILGGPGSQAAQEAETTIREAATRAGKNADDAWAGAQKVFDVLERTGRIPGIGSQTGGRLQAASEAANTGAIGTVTGASVAQPLSFLDRMLASTLQRGAYRQLGDLFTNPSPQAIDIMLRMARMSDNSASMLLPSLLNTVQREAQ